MKTAPILALAMLVLSACSTAPALKRYQPPLAAAFVNQAEASAAEPVAAFWRGFGDAQLDALVERALSANTDLRSAAARLQEARALGRVAGSQGLPSVDLSAGAARIRSPNEAGVVSTRSAFSAGFDVAWEADLFGRISGERAAAEATVLAGEAGVRAAQLSVSAEVARSYFELRGLQEQLRVARAALETQTAALKLVDARLEAGRGTALDTERARALLLSTAANVPALDAAVLRTRYRLAVLCGVPPTALDAELTEARPLPGLKAVALAGIGAPENLLKRRPDVQAADAQVTAAAANAGVARSALFPRITLGGTLGQNALRLGNLGDGASFAYNLGASLVWNVLDFGRLRALVTAADARSELALIAYERAVLAALEDTEGALASYSRSQQQAQALFDAARAAERAALIARERFSVGVSDFLTVLDAERELLAARDRLAQSQTAAATSLVGVYKALAGGW